MLPISAIILIWAGLGTMGPAAACLALTLGTGAAACAAGLAGLPLAALAWGLGPGPGSPRQPLGPLAAAVAVAISGTVLLPLLGVRMVGLIGLVLASAGCALAWTRRLPAAAAVPPQPWVLALAGAAAVAWTRCLSLLWGHSLYALCGFMAAACAGGALGYWLRDRIAAALDAAGIPRSLWVFASGLAGVLGLAWLRFIGINSGAADYLLSPLLGPGDLVFIAGQSALALALWCVPLPLSWGPASQGSLPRDRGPAAKAAAALIAAAGPLAAWALIPRLGAAETAAACHLAMAAAGLIRALRHRLLAGPVLPKAAAAGLVAALLLGLHSRSLFTDIWLNRLNAAWSGGRFLELVDDGRECLAVYRFSSGAQVLLRDGAAWFNDAAWAGRATQLPLLMHGSPRLVLLAGARSPASAAAAMAYGVELVALDPHPGAGRILRAQAPKGWPPPTGSRLTFVQADLRRHLRAAGPSYDAVILELPFPAQTPESARHATKDAFQELRGRLAPGGLAAVRLPAPYPPRSLARTLRTARAVFAHVGGWDLPGGYLLVCSDRPLLADAATLLSRRKVFAPSDESYLDIDKYLPSLPWADYSALPSAPSGKGERLPFKDGGAKPAAAALQPDTDDRLRTAFPLPDLVRGLTLADTATQALAQ